MKRYILALIVIWCFTTAFASVKVDTIYQVSHVDSVTIIESRDGLTINLSTDDGPSTIKFDGDVKGNKNIRSNVWHTRKSKERDPEKQGGSWVVFSGGIGLGYTAALSSPADLRTRTFGHIDFNWLYLLGGEYRFKGSRNSINFGVGFGTKFISTVSDQCVLPAASGLVTSDFQTGVVPKGCNMNFASFYLPVLYRQYLPINHGRTSLVFGPKLNYNLPRPISNKWLDANGNKVTQHLPKGYTRDFTVSAFGTLYITNLIGVYAEWSPMSVIKDPSMKISTLSFGIMLGF